MGRFHRHRVTQCRRIGWTDAVAMVVVAAIGVAAVAVARASDAPARAEQFAAAGQADRAILVREHAGWNADCDAIAHPALYLDEPPRHGRVCARTGDITIRSLYVGTESQCIGRQVHGVRLVYRPDAGFVGDDGMRYAVQYPSVRRAVSVTVTVSAGAAAAPDAVRSAISAPTPQTRQTSGPVPACAELLF
jgi:hypothetical protein